MKFKRGFIAIGYVYLDFSVSAVCTWHWKNSVFSEQIDTYVRTWNWALTMVWYCIESAVINSNARSSSFMGAKVIEPAHSVCAGSILLSLSMRSFQTHFFQVLAFSVLLGKVLTVWVGCCCQEDWCDALPRWCGLSHRSTSSEFWQISLQTLRDMWNTVQKS